MADDRDLDQVRADIDAIDRDIQALISRRARCAQRVAEIKLRDMLAARERGETEAEVVYYRPEREAQVRFTRAKRNHTMTHNFLSDHSNTTILIFPKTVFEHPPGPGEAVRSQFVVEDLIQILQLHGAKLNHCRSC